MIDINKMYHIKPQNESKEFVIDWDRIVFEGIKIPFTYGNVNGKFTVLERQGDSVRLHIESITNKRGIWVQFK